MANIRLYDPATRIYLASPLAFADWEHPTSAELNANPNNNPDGLIWNITCAVDRADSTFDLGDADEDDSRSFCQRASDSEATSLNTDFNLAIFRSSVPWIESDAVTFNTANLAFSLLAWRGIDYFLIASIGEAPDESFSVGDRVKMGRVTTTDPVDSIGTGDMARLIQSVKSRGDINWNYKLEA